MFSKSSWWNVLLPCWIEISWFSWSTVQAPLSLLIACFSYHTSYSRRHHHHHHHCRHRRRRDERAVAVMTAVIIIIQLHISNIVGISLFCWLVNFSAACVHASRSSVFCFHSCRSLCWCFFATYGQYDLEDYQLCNCRNEDQNSVVRRNHALPWRYLRAKTKNNNKKTQTNKQTNNNNNNNKTKTKPKKTIGGWR